MNLALDRFADNPIIDELVFWPPREQAIKRVRACSVLFRKPFIEVEMLGGEVFQRHFARDSFAGFWAEALVILETLTSIELLSDFSFTPVADRDALRRLALETRDECIAESDLMYAQGMYAQFLMQYGEDCRNLPAATVEKIAHAREAIRSAG